MSISLNNSKTIPDSAIIYKCYANLTMNFQLTSSLFLNQYDVGSFISVYLISNNNLQYVPDSSDDIYLRFKIPNNNGVKIPCYGWDDGNILYFQITNDMTRFYGYSNALIEISNSIGTKQSSKIYVTINQNPVNN